MLENDSIADKMEKSRKGNGLDGKRRGPAIQGVEQQAPWETSLQLELSLIGNGGMGFRRGLGTRVVMCGDTEASGAARRPRGWLVQEEPGAREGAWAMLTSSRWEREGWRKQERRTVGWTLEARTCWLRSSSVGA